MSSAALTITGPAQPSPPPSHVVPAWCVLPGEEDVAYLKFAYWLLSPNRGPVPMRHAELATRYQWQRRALAFDRCMRLDHAEHPSESVARIAQDALIMVRFEFSALARRAIEAPGQATLGELTALLKLMNDIGLQASSAGSTDEIDYDRASVEDLAVLASAAEVMNRLKVRR